MNDYFLDIVRDISLNLSVILPILYLKGFTQNGKAFRFFTFYLVSIAGIQLGMKAMRLIHPGENNLYFFIYFFVLQFIWLSFFYKELLQSKWVYYITGIALLVIGIQYALEPALYFKYNPLGVTITQILLVVYSMIYLYKSLSNKKDFQLINVGVLLYLLPSTLIFASGNLSFNLDIPRSFMSLLSDLNVIIYLLFQVLILLQWWRMYYFKPPVDSAK